MNRKFDLYKKSHLDKDMRIPESWSECRLKFLATYNDETLPDTTIPTLEIDYVDISSVDLRQGITKVENLTFEKAPSRARRVVKNGDILVSTVRTYLKAITKVTDAQNNLIVSTGFAVIRPSREVDNQYLAYFLISEYFVEKVVAHSVGVSYPAINASDLVRLPIFYPSEINLQIKIRQYLDFKTNQIDQLIEKKKQLIEKLEEKRIAMITQAVTKGLDENVEMKPSGVEWLGDLPKHWEVRKLKFCCNFLNNRRIPLSSETRTGMSQNYPYYGASGIIDYVDDYIFDEPTILIAEDGANLLSRSTDLAFIAKGKYWVNNHAHILKPTEGSFNYWANLLCVFRFDPWITGSAQPKLNKEKLSTIHLPYPPISEQSEISEFIDYHLSRTIKLKLKIDKAVQALLEYRSSLITSTVTGKVDLSNVNSLKEFEQ